MLDMARYAKAEGLNPLMIILEMDVDDLRIDYDLVDFDIKIINVSYKYISWKRLMHFPKTSKQIYRLIKSGLAENGIVMSATYDLLAIAYLSSVFIKFRIKHQVRDLVKLQMGTGFLSWVIRYLEKFMLRRVELIAVSSDEFYHSYYKKLYKGEYVLTENVPPSDVWEGFTKDKSKVFTIGYIGIVRYKEPLYELIRTTERLFEEGYNVKVHFAGGGVVDDLKALINQDHLFKFSGSFEYSKDIKRLYADVDLIFAVYDAQDLNCQVAMPTKYYESITARIPILVSSNTYIGRVVEEQRTGSSVDLKMPDNMYDLLLDAINNRGWYKEAQDNLDRFNIKELYRAYLNALAKCIE